MLLALLLAGELFTGGLAPLDAGAPAAELSARACLPCHAAAHGEWAASRHGRAFTNAIFQREYRDQPLEWCVHCHAPLREQLAQVRAGGGPLADEGVGCASCHLRGGHVLAARQRPGSPHRTEVRPDFGGPGFCAGCHQFNFPLVETRAGQARVTGYSRFPMQDTVAQHARGARAATPCLGCHGASPAGHAFPGGHDPGMLERAVSLDACRAGLALRLTVTNVGAGHNVPTGDLHRHLVLRAWRPSAPERLHETLFGRRFAPARGGGKRTIHDATLAPGHVRMVHIPLRALGPGRLDEPLRVELRLVYTIDEFPFPGRALAEPTYATITSRALDWPALSACPPRAGRVRVAARAP
jgi:Cytochrome c554 and c-prime